MFNINKGMENTIILHSSYNFQDFRESELEWEEKRRNETRRAKLSFRCFCSSHSRSALSVTKNNTMTKSSVSHLHQILIKIYSTGEKRMWLKKKKARTHNYFAFTQASQFAQTCSGPTYFYSSAQKVNTINCPCQSGSFTSHPFDKNPSFGKLVAGDSKRN